jgi:hypothetical protein
MYYTYVRRSEWYEISFDNEQTNKRQQQFPTDTQQQFSTDVQTGTTVFNRFTATTVLKK